MTGAPPPAPARPPMPPPGYGTRPGATRLALGRLLLTLLLVGILVVGMVGWYWWSKRRATTVPAAEAPAWTAGTQQANVYKVPDVLLPTAEATPPDPNAGLKAQLSQLMTELGQQKAEIEALKRRPTTTTTVATPPAPPPKPAPARPQPAPMLYVAHEVKDPVPPKPKVPEYTLAPGATKLPCIVETAINSDVPGHFTSKVSTNVYDTATGRHLLVPQGSTILAHDQSQDLLYGNQRLPTISLTLTLPNGRSVDLGNAPMTDQQGVTGLTGTVDNHWLRLVGAVFVGGALRGGQQALQTSIAQAGGAGQVASGISSYSTQLGQQRAGRAMDTRPTIAVQSGQLCYVLLIKPLSLPALWQ